jgi:hypothetical protein
MWVTSGGFFVNACISDENIGQSARVRTFFLPMGNRRLWDNDNGAIGSHPPHSHWATGGYWTRRSDLTGQTRPSTTCRGTWGYLAEMAGRPPLVSLFRSLLMLVFLV